METTAQELVYSIVDEIEGDVILVRGKKEKHYLTGIEVAVWLGTLVLSSFLTGFFKGLQKGAEETGVEIGKKAFDTFKDRILQVGKKLRLINVDEKSETKQVVEDQQEELDRIMAELSEIKKQVTVNNLRHRVTEYEREEIRTVLIENGFPEQKALVYSEKITQVIEESWFSETDSSK